RLLGCCTIEPDGEGGYRLSDVLQSLVAPKLEPDRNFLASKVHDAAGDADAPGVGQFLEACRYVHDFAVKIVALPDPFPAMRPDAPLDPASIRPFAIGVTHASLDRGCAFDGI